MPGKEKEPDYGLTGKASLRDDPGAAARQVGSDDMYQGAGMSNTPSPDGDESGENRVATSLSDE